MAVRKPKSITAPEIISHISFVPGVLHFKYGTANLSKQDIPSELFSRLEGGVGYGSGLS